MSESAWTIDVGGGPVVATAIHAGHEVRPEIVPFLRVDDRTRRQEEDPYTDRWTNVADNRIVVRSSRFEVDLNRTVDHAVYRRPDEAWGIDVWDGDPAPQVLANARWQHQGFYNDVARSLSELGRAHRRLMVLDLHSFEPRGDRSAPDIVLGTASVDRSIWGNLLGQFHEALHGAEIGGRRLVVQENTRFQGGHFPRWINSNFAQDIVAIAVEVKKVYRDETAVQLDDRHVQRIGELLRAVVPDLARSLERH